MIKQNSVLPVSSFLKSYAIGLCVFLAIDSVWLSTATQFLYRPGIGHLMADTVNFIAAFSFYLIYVVGVVALAAAPAKSGSGALWRGALLGLVSYGTYDITNQAVMKDWPWLVTILDILWGSFLTALVACSAWWGLHLSKK